MQFESPLPHKLHADNRMVFSVFSFIENYGDKTVPMLNFRNVRVFKGKRWYVEFYYRVPKGLGFLYDNKDWKRFRIFEDINRRKGEEQKEYATLLANAVKKALKSGYNPFEEKEKIFIRKEGIAATVESVIKEYQDYIEEGGLDKSTKERYKNISTWFLNYMDGRGMKTISAENISEEIVVEYMRFKRREKGWSNRHYNNVLNYTSTMFEWIKKKKKITDNPCENIPRLNFVSYKHRYYDDKLLKKVSDYLKAHDPYLYMAAQFVYYAGIRSSKELINLQVGDILMDRERIRFRGNATKGKRDDYIVLDPMLKKIIEDNKISKFPDHYYVFTFNEHPHEVRSEDQFLQKRFRKLRRALKLSEDYTLYGFKHTRAVHLLMDGAEPIDIMQLFRHHDLTATSKYIRDLGFDLNAKFTSKSRSI